MTVARRLLVDLEVTRYYHCISRCVRQAWLCGQGHEHRKAWIEERLELLASNFAVSVCGFAVLDNHLHVLCRLDPSVAPHWDDREVVRRWMAVYPPPTLDREDAACVRAWVEHAAKDLKRVAIYRQRLQDLGWFMKALKEPLARMANQEDGCKGTFWEGRYKSIAILDEEALLATCVYIDLNPVAAGIAATPETSRHTSVRQRVLHARRTGQLRAVKEAVKGSVAGSRATKKFEDAHWLCPIDDRPDGDTGRQGREGMVANFSLGSYLLLLDHTSRICRGGKAHVSRQAADIFERMGTSAEYWEHRIQKMFDKGRLMGSYFAVKMERLREVAARRGVHHVDNTVAVA